MKSLLGISLSIESTLRNDRRRLGRRAARLLARKFKQAKIPIWTKCGKGWKQSEQWIIAQCHLSSMVSPKLDLYFYHPPIPKGKR